MRFILVPIVAVSLLAGCASESKIEAQQEKEFVTGSNIPRKERSGVTVAGKESLERMQSSGGGPVQRGSEVLR